MEAAHGDLHAEEAQPPGEIHGVRELIRLHPDQADETPTAAFPDLARQPIRPDARIGFVKRMNFNLDGAAERMSRATILRKSMQHGERVGGNGGTRPLNDIAVIVVVRWLDQIEQEPVAHRAHHAASNRLGRHVGFVVNKASEGLIDESAAADQIRLQIGARAGIPQGQ
ncbi:MAG: hypothetical protein ACLQE9_19760 [Roseiarcus sp.]